MGKVIRLNDAVEAWLDKIDKNTNKALDTVKSSFITNKELNESIKSITVDVMDIKDDIINEIRDLKS